MSPTEPSLTDRPLEILDIERVFGGGTQRALRVRAEARESFVPVGGYTPAAFRATDNFCSRLACP